MTEIHIDWEGPFSADELRNNLGKDYAIYQLYGEHPIYGNTLLYIGDMQESPSVSHVSEIVKKNVENFKKYWTSDDPEIFIGHLRGNKLPDKATWLKEIALAKELLIYAHSPAWNSKELFTRIKEGEELFNTHVFNWGRHKRLLPEVSGRRCALYYPKDKDYKKYSLLKR